MTDEMKDVVFFGRPAGSRPNSTATIFVLEGNSHARRVTVQYGAMSGSLIQVLARPSCQQAGPDTRDWLFQLGPDRWDLTPHNWGQLGGIYYRETGVNYPGRNKHAGPFRDTILTD